MKKTIEFVVASHNEDILNKNLLRSKIFERYNLIVQRGYSNVSKAYNDAKTTADIVVYLHHDVFLPDNFEERLLKSIDEITAIDENWGVLGPAGVILEKGKRVAYGNLKDRNHEWGKADNLPHEIQTLDELMLIIQDKKLKFDEKIPSTHFYGADICLQAELMGKKNYAINAYCNHNSGLMMGELPKGFSDAEEYIRNKYSHHLPIITTCSNIHKVDRKEPLISVIIPSRVGEKIDSLPFIQKQTYKNIELIIEYDTEKLGVSHTRNQGYAKRKGNIVFFCDNDIELVPDAIENMYKKMKMTNSAWVFGRVIIDNNDITPSRGDVPKNIHSPEYIDYFQNISTMSLIDTVALNNFDDKVFDENLKRYTDWDLWVRLDKEGYYGTFLNKVIFSTESRPTGISMQDDMEKRMDILYKKHKISRKLADIIIPHHNRHDYLINCLNKLDNSIFNIIVVSGGTFAENCNKGASLAETDNIIFMNDDIEVLNEALVDLALSEYDICGNTQIIDQTKFYGLGWQKNGKATHDGIVLARVEKDALIPSGYCFKVKRDVWEKLGGFNENYRNGAEDCEFGFNAIKRGFSIGYIDKPMIHYNSQSKGRFTYSNENNDLFNSRWTEQDMLDIKKIIENSPLRKGKLSIVISGVSMGHLTGQPMYCYELARQLRKEGHYITVVSDWKSYNGKEGYILRENLEDIGVTCLSFGQKIEGKQDLWLASEPQSAQISIDAPMINIIHSEYDCEAPIENGPVAYICIRQSIVEHIVKEHNIPREMCYVIFNGIDRERFKKKEKTKRNYKKVVVPCTYDNLRMKMIHHLIDMANESKGKFRVEFYSSNMKNKVNETKYVKVFPDTFHIEDAIADADEVAGILLGRVNLEANSCGVPSVIYDPETLAARGFLMSDKEFDNKYNIKNISKQILHLAKDVINERKKIEEFEERHSDDIDYFKKPQKPNPIVSMFVNSNTRKKRVEEESTIFKIAHATHLPNKR